MAEAIGAALADAGTELLFGMPGGGANLDLIGAAGLKGLRFILTHTETGGAIMASAYAELTGRPGACLATRGPGAASIANGVAQAFLDRTPLLAVTDSVAASEAVRVSRQRFDHQALFSPIVKWSVRIGPDRPARVAEGAVRIASEGRPGPVHLDLAADAAFEPAPEFKISPNADPSAARELVAGSDHPLFILGLGARAAAETVRRLVVDSPWPVLTTYKAKGIIPESWENSAGLFSGGRLEAALVERADLIIAVGLDPVELIPAKWTFEAPVLSITPWPRDADYYVPDVELFGPVADLLEAVVEFLPRRSGLSGSQFREESLAALDSRDESFSPQAVVKAARRLAPLGTTATVDAGAHMLVAMPFWTAENVTETMISSGHATMGFAVPAAIAAALVRPERATICFVGDGGLGITLAELETIARLQLPVIIVVFNDSSLSLIEIKRVPEQNAGSASTAYGTTDYATIAAGFGIEGCQVKNEKELESALETALQRNKPTLIDAVIDSSDYSRVLKILRG